MGLSESKPEPKHDTLYSRFSSKELQKLEQYFDFKEKSESPPKQGINTAKNVTVSNYSSSSMLPCIIFESITVILVAGH